MSTTHNTPDPIVDAGDETRVSKAELDRLKAKLRAQAERKVIENHRDEYHQIAEELFSEAGLEFRRRKTDEEKAEEQMEALLAAHPELAGRFVINKDVTGSPEDPSGDQDEVSEGPAALEDDYRPF